jgi:hypothetical protein
MPTTTAFVRFDHKQLAADIEDYCRAYNVLYVDFASAMGVHPDTLRRMLRGIPATGPNSTTAAAACSVLGTKLDDYVRED